MSQNYRIGRYLRPGTLSLYGRSSAHLSDVWMLLMALTVVSVFSGVASADAQRGGPNHQGGRPFAARLTGPVLPEEYSAFAPLDPAEVRTPAVPSDTLTQFTIGLEAYLAGSFYLQDDRIDEAVVEFRRAISADPGNLDAALLLAQAFHQGGRLDSALVWAERVARAAPDLSGPARLAGMTLVRQGRREEALDRFLAARELDPEDTTTLMNLLTLYEQLGRGREALDLIYPALSPALELPSIYLRRARLLALHGSPLDAVMDLARVLRRDPAFPEAEPMLHLLLDNLGDPPGTAPILDELLLEQPRMSRVRLRLTRSLIGSGDWQAAVPHLEILVRDRPEDAILARQLGIYYLRLGRIADSRQALLEASRSAPEDPEPYRWLWRVENQDGRPEEAFEMAEALLQRSPDDEEAGILQAVSLAQLDRKDEALLLSDQLLERDPARRDAALVSATLLEEGERYSEAAARLIPLLKHSPEDSELLLRLGFLFEKAGDFEKSISMLDRLLEVQPDNHMALNHAGYMCIERGVRLEESLERVRRALELDPDNAAYLDSYGWGLFQTGDPEGALPYLQRAAELLPDEPIVLRHLGDAKAALGDREGAACLYRRALELAPDDAEAEEKLRDLEDSLDSAPAHQR